MDLRALIFMPALVGAVILGFVFLLFASYYYLSVLEGTAAGAKEISWVGGPITDHFGGFCYLAWLIGLWFGPAYLIGRGVAAGTGSSWVVLLVPLAVLWVCYPVSQLSSLSASSLWMPLVPDVFARLAQKPLVVAQFLALSAVVLAVFGVGFRWVFRTEGEWELLFLGAPLVVLSALLYARLLGRLAFVLRFTRGLFPTKRRRRPKADAETSGKANDSPKPRQVQPRELPPVATPDGDLEGYDLKFEDDPPPVPKKRVRAELNETEPEPAPEPTPASRPRHQAPASAVERGRVWTDEDDEEPTAYGVREAEVNTAAAIPGAVMDPSADELRLLSREDAPKKPRRLWGGGLLAFLAQPSTLSAVFIASGLCFALGAMVRIARAYNPAAGGE